jgi:hypothetical protein
MRANEFITEKWSEKYKRSINCSSPRGFSQRAHCQGRKKNKIKEDSGTTVSGNIAVVAQPVGGIITRQGFGNTAKYANSPYKAKKKVKDAGR